MAPERETAREVIRHRCETPGCGAVLAKEHPNGDIEPVVIGARWNRRGQLTVECPDCERVKVLPIRRAA